MIAVAAIVKNEEAVLERMLRSCKGIPVYIVDTGSSDNTYKIYEKYGVKWKKYSKWNDCEGTAPDFHFSEARNEALEFSDAEWNIILDADEQLGKKFIRDAKKLLSGDMSKYDVVTVKVETNSEVLDSPRILRNIPELRYEDPVHNRLPYAEDHREKAYMSDLFIKSGYSPNHDKDKHRTERLLQAAVQREPGKARYYYYLAREYMTLYQDKKILDIVGLLEHYTYLAINTNEKADAHLILAVSYHKMRNPQRAKEHAWEALKIIPTLKEAWQILYEVSHPKFKGFFKEVQGIANNDGALTVRQQRKNKMK